MALFDRRKRTITVDGKTIELEPPRRGIGFIFNRKPRAQPTARPAPQPTLQSAPQPAAAAARPAQQQPQQAARPMQQPPIQRPQTVERVQPARGPAPGPTAAPAAATAARVRAMGRESRIRLYITGLGAKHKGLEAALHEQGIKESLYEFTKRMLIAAVMLTAALAVTSLILFLKLGLNPVASVVLALVLGIGIYQTSISAFMNFPTAKGRQKSKNIERDILFAARDMIISLRSGMPLFNAITSISVGYGDASKEFARVVERVQLGQPLEDAIDQTVAETKSPSFRRIMLQASVSIRAGADVVGALQGVIDQLAQERVIELRRYGQTLNALAMFYMLFGIILPSMGIAVLTILTTFIALFTVTPALLVFAIIGILFMQIVFLQIIRSTRPVFTM